LYYAAALSDVPLDLAACVDDDPQQSTIPIGTVGDAITDVEAQFDGWGYVHLFRLNADGAGSGTRERWLSSPGRWPAGMRSSWTSSHRSRTAFRAAAGPFRSSSPRALRASSVG
jgi:hypothetical protein